MFYHTRTFIHLYTVMYMKLVLYVEVWFCLYYFSILMHTFKVLNIGVKVPWWYIKFGLFINLLSTFVEKKA